MPDELVSLGLDGATILADLASAPTGVPGGSLASLAFKLVAGVATRIEQQKALTALKLLVEEWARVGDLPRQEAARRVQELTQGGHPQADSLLYSCFRHMAFSRCDSAWPYIARLTADYVHHGKSADAFFRRCGWLLERAEKSDVALLETVVAKLDDAEQEDRERYEGRRGPLFSVVVKLKILGDYHRHAISLFLMRRKGDTSSGGAARRMEGDVEISDFYNLLRESRLCFEQPGQLVLLADRGNVEGLMNLFRKPEPAAQDEVPEND